MEQDLTCIEKILQQLALNHAVSASNQDVAEVYDLLGRHTVLVLLQKTEKVYCLEYTDNPKVKSTIHHEGHCCTNVITGHCLKLLFILALM